MAKNQATQSFPGLGIWINIFVDWPRQGTQEAGNKGRCRLCHHTRFVSLRTRIVADTMNPTPRNDYLRRLMSDPHLIPILSIQP